MSEDIDKICRAILFQAKMAKNLKVVINAIEVIAGAENTAFVNEKITQMQDEQQ